ncbi:hypothetical protein BJ741DRAFT_606594 [Chytriomyces cf. hyalinus JEL632]|nr:hypothetical protein BJ741DRAFT_606594 [Chytriomyces cf. hyalinus JEL632]
MQTTQLFLSNGNRGTKATFTAHKIRYLMGAAVEESSDGVSTQFVLSKKNTPLDSAVSVQLDMWADLVSDSILADSDAFDAAAFVAECMRRGIIDALKVSKKRVLNLWAQCKSSAAFNRIVVRLGHKWTAVEMKAIGDGAIDSFFAGRWHEMSPTGIAFLISIFDILHELGITEPFLVLAAEAAEVVKDVLDLLAQEPLDPKNPTQLSHRLKRTAAFFPN